MHVLASSSGSHSKSSVDSSMGCFATKDILAAVFGVETFGSTRFFAPADRCVLLRAAGATVCDVLAGFAELPPAAALFGTTAVLLADLL
jgi:hypothetical protein